MICLYESLIKSYTGSWEILARGDVQFGRVPAGESASWGQEFLRYFFSESRIEGKSFIVGDHRMFFLYFEKLKRSSKTGKKVKFMPHTKLERTGTSPTCLSPNWHFPHLVLPQFGTSPNCHFAN